MQSSREMVIVPPVCWADPWPANDRAMISRGRIVFFVMIGLLIVSRSPAPRAVRDHSYLRASMGSSREAFRAG